MTSQTKEEIIPNAINSLREARYHLQNEFIPSDKLGEIYNLKFICSEVIKAVDARHTTFKRM